MNHPYLEVCGICGESLGAVEAEPVAGMPEAVQTGTKVKMKKCPFCAEEIRAEAIKCKHCQTVLNEASEPTASEPKRHFVCTFHDENKKRQTRYFQACDENQLEKYLLSQGCEPLDWEEKDLSNVTPVDISKKIRANDNSARDEAKIKKCPYCAEQIQDDAIVCPHCQKELRRRTGAGKIFAGICVFLVAPVFNVLGPFVGVPVLIVGYGLAGFLVLRGASEWINFGK